MFFITCLNQPGTMLQKFKYLAKVEMLYLLFILSILLRKIINTNFFVFNICLCSVLQNLADRQLKARYIVATDTSKDSLIRITRKVSQKLGTGKIKVVDQEDAMLNRDISVSDFI